MHWILEWEGCWETLFSSETFAPYLQFIYIFHIFICILYPLWVYYQLTMWPAPSWLDSSVGKAMHRFSRGCGIPFRPEFFPGCNFTISCLDTFLRSLNIWYFIYSIAMKSCFPRWKIFLLVDWMAIFFSSVLIGDSHTKLLDQFGFLCFWNMYRSVIGALQ